MESIRQNDKMILDADKVRSVWKFSIKKEGKLLISISLVVNRKPYTSPIKPTIIDQHKIVLRIILSFEFEFE